MLVFKFYDALNNKQISRTVLFPLNGNDPKTHIHIIIPTQYAARHAANVIVTTQPQLQYQFVGFFFLNCIYNFCIVQRMYAKRTCDTVPQRPHNKLVELEIEQKIGFYI